jgi:GxxExxY protein
MGEEDIGRAIITASMNVHSALGPGLLESVYERCMEYELVSRGMHVSTQKPIEVRYADLVIDNAYRMDLLVNERVVVELKAVEKVLPVHRSQLLSYLKLGQYKLGYLLNFDCPHMREGIVRLVNGL